MECKDKTIYLFAVNINTYIFYIDFILNIFFIRLSKKELETSDNLITQVNILDDL